MNTVQRSPLSERMHALADTGHERGPELRELADAMDQAAVRVVAGKIETTKRFVGCWARARRAWCDVTGEPLI